MRYLLVWSALLVAGCTSDPVLRSSSSPPSAPGLAPEPVPSEQRLRGPSAAVGDGTATAFLQLLADGTPAQMGVELSPGALQNLPTAHGDGRACYDLDNDGSHDPMAECILGHEYILDLPALAGLPFQYVMLNWNPGGHPPPHVYDLPHFDVHFYLQDLEAVRQMAPGPCSFMDCEVYDRARKPVPAPYWPPGYADVNAVEPMMGNHAVNPSAAEFNGEVFTRTFLYGFYDGQITFYEPMITRDYFLSRASECDPIALPEAWAVGGWYPTAYCTGYENDTHLVYLEGFVWRGAS